MRISRVNILGSVAFGFALSLALPQSGVISLGTGGAEAAIDVAINLGTFYDRLAPYGAWVRRNNVYLFVPAVSPDWRPYTRGHWEYSARFGWIWISGEQFGWATYHYGRWGFDERIGWYWIPATQWAPAWVSWRRSNDFIAWAPLPPDRSMGIDDSIDIDSEQFADRYWAVVPASGFLEADLGKVVIPRGDNRARRAFREARPLGGVRIANNIFVNNVITVADVERATRKKVRIKEVREVRDVDEARRAGADDSTVAVFAPKVEKRASDKPRDVKSADEVSRRRKDQPAEPRQFGEDAQDTKPKLQEQKAQGAEERVGGTQTKKRQQLQQSDTGKVKEQVLKRKPDRSEKAIEQPRGNRPNAQSGNRDQGGRLKQGCAPGARNCP